ncbi:hypothetical protein ONZ45_g15505 [Pleurotus djamor]|nr:hypothetical protein ONZ45_g15505 [Pleurotus djamor]
MEWTMSTHPFSLVRFGGEHTVDLLSLERRSPGCSITYNDSIEAKRGMILRDAGNPEKSTKAPAAIFVVSNAFQTSPPRSTSWSPQKVDRRNLDSPKMTHAGKQYWDVKNMVLQRGHDCLRYRRAIPAR